LNEPKVAWDEDKADANRTKHGVDFFEAVDVLQDPLAVTVSVRRTPTGEERVNIVGQSRRGRLLHLTVTQRGSIIRMISARRATTRERYDYEEG